MLKSEFKFSYDFLYFCFVDLRTNCNKVYKKETLLTERRTKDTILSDVM